MGMPLKDFVELAWPGIQAQREHYVVGKSLAPDDFFDKVERARIDTLTTALDNFVPPKH